MNINFVYVPTPDKYNGVIDTMVDPILEYLPEGRKVEAPIKGDLNVNFFTEIEVAGKRGIDTRTQNFIDAIFPPALRGTSGQVTAEILRGLAHGRN